MDELYLYSLIQDIRENPILKDANLSALEVGLNVDAQDQQILSQARDWASSSIKTQNTFLESIFPNLSLGKKAQKKFYNHFELTLSRSFFPTTSPVENANLVKSFEAAVQKITGNNVKIKAETFLHVLHKYGAAIPSNYGADVSFYDYAKVKAAIACCLKQDEDEILLIGGGVSGIQRYLYDIMRRKASITLKGRSFFIQLVVDQVVQFLIRELSLHQANILYASGGNFYLIAPGNTIDQLKNLELQIAERLYLEFKTSFTLELDGVLMNQKGITSNPGQYWTQLGRKNSIKKNQPFKLLMQEPALFDDNQSGFDVFFNNLEVGGEAPRDVLTNEEIGDQKTEPIEQGSDDIVLTTTKKQINLGRVLRNATQIGQSSNPNKNSYDPLNLNISYHFKNGSVQLDQLILLNGLNFVDRYAENQITGFKFYGGNKSPVFNEDHIDKEGHRYEKGDSKTFEQLAEGSSRFTRLGFLRMDVDNLGKTIINTFQGKGNSLARFSTFSRSIDYFFKGYLNTLWEENEDYKEFVQIIYAGGDDLFMVGRWDIIIAFAKDIRTSFAAWVGKDSSLTLSGGVALVGPKFPISKAALMAGDAEDAAKDYEVEVESEILYKNAFTLLGVPLHWEFDFPVVEELKNLLVLYLSKSLPKSVLMNIQSFHAQKAFQQKNGLAQSWRWRAAYSFARAGDRIKRRDAHIAEWLKEQSEKIMFNSSDKRSRIKSKHDYFDLLNVAARWAELESRSKK